MSPSVEIDDDIFEYLKSQAEPFTDTPSSVLRRLLEMNGGAARKIQADVPRPADDGTKPAQRSATKRSKGKKSSGRARAAAGTLLPESAYEMPMLRALVDAGGEAPYRDVLESVGRQLSDKLMPADHEKLGSGGIRWHSRLQFVRLRLIEREELDRDAPRGVWRITDKGRQALIDGSES